MAFTTEETIVKSVCMLCFQVCGIDAHVKDGKLIGVESMKEHAATHGVLCPRGHHLVDYTYSSERIKTPLIREKKDGSLRQATWDEALNYIADKLNKIKAEFGPKSVAVSVGSIGAENILISAFAQRWRAAFGTPNFFSIEAHCFRTRIMSRLFTMGSYPLSDIDNADCIILWGHNPDASEPPVAARIHNLVDKGKVQIIVIDPKKIPLAKKGIYLQIRPGTDCALALSMMNVIITEELYDKTIVRDKTIGFEKLVDHVKAYTPEKVAEICGCSPEEIRKISRIFATAKGACIEQGINTLDQHINGFQNSRALAILQVITGNYNRPGAWCVNPFMRLSDLRLPVEGEPIGAKEYPIFRSFWGMTSPYGQQMLLPDVILSEKPYPIKAMIVSAGNPLQSWPNTNKLIQAFKKLDMLVVTDLFMNDTAQLADVVLPVCSAVETLGLAYNYGLTMGISFVMLSRKLIEPIGDSKPDWWIYSELAKKMGFGEYFPWQTEEEVVEHFLKPSGINLNQLMVEHPEGIIYGKRSYELPAKIKTPSGKLEIYSNTLAEAGYDPLPVHKEPSQSPVADPQLSREYNLILVTGSRIVEYTHWQMKNIPALKKLAPEPIAWINPAVAESNKVKDNDLIIVETKNGKVKVRANITSDIMPGVVSLTHGWQGVLNSNNLVDLEPRDPVTGYAEFRNVACRIRRTDN